MCVVGGGIAGCSAALHLAERGLKVVLLEEHRVGWGASGRSGAQVIPGVAAGQAKLDALIGAEAARTVWDVSVEGLELMRPLIRRYGIDCDWVDGHMLTAVKERTSGSCRRAARAARRYGYPSVRYLPREELRAHRSTATATCGALYDSNSGHLHPLNYTLGLAAAAEPLGARIFEGTRALAFTGRGLGVRVRDHAGRGTCPAAGRCAATSSSGTPRPRWRARSWRSPPTSSPPSRWASARAAADRQQRRRLRHELGARLLPPLRRITGCCSADG